MKNLFYTCHNLIYVLHEYKKNVEEYKNKRKKRRRNKIFALAINVRINTTIHNNILSLYSTQWMIEDWF